MKEDEKSVRPKNTNKIAKHRHSSRALSAPARPHAGRGSEELRSRLNHIGSEEAREGHRLRISGPPLDRELGPKAEVRLAPCGISGRGRKRSRGRGAPARRHGGGDVASRRNRVRSSCGGEGPPLVAGGAGTPLISAR